MQWTHSGITVFIGMALIAGCAATDGGGSGADPWADSGPRRAPATEQPAASSGGANRGVPSAAGAGKSGGSPTGAARGGSTETPTEIARPTGKVEWVAVFESPPGAKYNDQRVIYVDRNSVQPHPIESLTYYLARTREVTRSGAKPKIQEIAVLCEGSPIAPATSLRGEGTEENGGSYSLKRAAAPLTSVSQFSTQRLRADANNPNTFIVRAVCLLGTSG